MPARATATFHFIRANRSQFFFSSSACNYFRSPNSFTSRIANCPPSPGISCAKVTLKRGAPLPLPRRPQPVPGHCESRVSPSRRPRRPAVCGRLPLPKDKTSSHRRDSSNPHVIWRDSNIATGKNLAVQNRSPIARIAEIPNSNAAPPADSLANGLHSAQRCTPHSRSSGCSTRPGTTSPPHRGGPPTPRRCPRRTISQPDYLDPSQRLKACPGKIAFLFRRWLKQLNAIPFRVREPSKLPVFRIFHFRIDIHTGRAQVLQHAVEIVHLKVQHHRLRHRKLIRALLKKRHERIPAQILFRKHDESALRANAQMRFVPRVQRLRIVHSQKRPAQSRYFRHKSPHPETYPDTLPGNFRQALMPLHHPIGDGSIHVPQFSREKMVDTRHHHQFLFAGQRLYQRFHFFHIAKFIEFAVHKEFRLRALSKKRKIGVVHGRPESDALGNA